MAQHTEVVLSHFQADSLLKHRGKIEEVEVSPDLEFSTGKARVEERGVRFPNGIEASWGELGKISADTNGCFVIDESGAWRIQAYSEATHRTYSLMPTAGAPTLLVSGIPMHRIKSTDPYTDALEKIATLRPLHGRVLDTATGLGYTAIQAAQSAERVVTVELDPVVLEIARENPWSSELFANSRIDCLIGDSAELVYGFRATLFEAIIHDPPTFSLAGELYSLEFYVQMLRILRGGGRLFHYIGDPDSRSGRNTTRGVVQRLKTAGFRRIAGAPRAFGIVAWK